MPGFRGLGRPILLVVVLALVALSPGSATAQDAAMPVEYNELAENTARYVDQLVTVRAEVENIISPLAFTVDTSGWFDPDMLVVHAQGRQPVTPTWPYGAIWVPTDEGLLESDRMLQVTAVVKIFNPIEFERQLGLVFDDPGLYSDWEGKTVLVATGIEPVRGER